jgi:hypothetical protein
MDDYKDGIIQEFIVIIAEARGHKCPNGLTVEGIDQDEAGNFEVQVYDCETGVSFPVSFARTEIIAVQMAFEAGKRSNNG